MQKRKIKKYLFFILFPAFLFGGYGAKGQNTDALGTYTPYSLYGLGNIEKQGTAVNRAMGGIGTALRSNRYINYMNPASITNRDTLSFMLDFGGDQKNIYSTDGISKTAYNTGNVKSFIFSAPIYKKSALIVGIVPYSNIGYKFENMESDPALVSQYGDIRYRKYGEGSINQLFVGGAMNFLKNFSIGAQYIYYFGSLDRYSNVLFGTDASIRSITTGWDYSLGASSVKAGLQYFREFGEMEFGETIRRIVKLDHDATMKAFSKFINDASLNQEQIRFVHKIIQYLENEGVMDVGDLMKSPFDKPLSFIRMFDKKTMTELIDVIKDINTNATVIVDQ